MRESSRALELQQGIARPARGADSASRWVQSSGRALRWTCLAVVCAGFVASASGCREDRTRVTASPTSFVVDADLFSEYDEDVYTWNTALTQARVEFRVRGFNEGFVRIDIYDADGFLVFGRDYYDYDYYCCYDFNEELTDIAFTEAGGTPGEWTVFIEYFDFTGHLYLVID